MLQETPHKGSRHQSGWSKALKACADPLRAKHFFDLLSATSARPNLENMSSEQARILAALFGGSQALGNLLVAHPDWLGLLDPALLRFSPRKQGLLNELSGGVPQMLGIGDY